MGSFSSTAGLDPEPIMHSEPPLSRDVTREEKNSRICVRQACLYNNNPYFGFIVGLIHYLAVGLMIYAEWPGPRVWNSMWFLDSKVNVFISDWQLILFN